MTRGPSLVKSSEKKLNAEGKSSQVRKKIECRSQVKSNQGTKKPNQENTGESTYSLYSVSLDR
jgi:hypothetical protein